MDIQYRVIYRFGFIDFSRYLTINDLPWRVSSRVFENEQDAEKYASTIAEDRKAFIAIEKKKK